MGMPERRLSRRLQWTLLAFFAPGGTISGGGLHCCTIDRYAHALAHILYYQ